MPALPDVQTPSVEGTPKDPAAEGPGVPDEAHAGGVASGDQPATHAGETRTRSATDSAPLKGLGQWALWEVFTQAAQGAPHEHAGSLHAPDAELALQNARDVYTRRGEAVSLWVVPSQSIVASAPSDAGPFFDPADDKPYRHPQFYKVPRGVKGL